MCVDGVDTSSTPVTTPTPSSLPVGPVPDPPPVPEMASLPLTREARLRLIRERLDRGESESLDVARLVDRRLLRDGFPGTPER